MMQRLPIKAGAGREGGGVCRRCSLAGQWPSKGQVTGLAPSLSNNSCGSLGVRGDGVDWTQVSDDSWGSRHVGQGKQRGGRGVSVLRSC